MISSGELQRLGLDAAGAERVASAAGSCLSEEEAESAWRRITETVLTPDLPFEVHRYVRDRVFAGWGAERGPVPLWTPTERMKRESNIGRLMRETGFEDYASLHRWSVDEPEAFWRRTLAALGVRFRTPPDRIVDGGGDARRTRWLPGARFNICESCFQAERDAPAIVSGSAAGGIEVTTYGELDAWVHRVAGGLRRMGFGPGDAIAIDMGMTAESVAVYLGIIKTGCVAVSIAESFAAPEVRTRLRIAGAKAVFTAWSVVRGGKRLPIYEKIVQAEGPRAIVLGERDSEMGERGGLRDGDVTWAAFLDGAPSTETHVASSEEWINVLFSSGTTADPKAIPWSHTTPIKCASDGHYHHDIRPGDVVCWPTSLGWMMGPWLVFASLMNRASMALYDEVPTGRGFGAFVSEAGVTMLGVVPSLVRAWRASGCMKGLDWSRVRVFSSTGECSAPEDMHYLMHLAGYRPIIEYCGGTEIGGGYITSTVVQPNAPSTFTGPALGSDFVILDDANAPADEGELYLIPPALGLSSALLNADHDEVYHAGTPTTAGRVLRRHGDQMRRLAGGFYRALGRADDAMNLGGVKVASAEIERVVLLLDGVREAAAIAAAEPGGGPSRLVVYAVVEARGGLSAEAWRMKMQEAIRRELNPLFKIADVRIVERLPRTASNKVMRRQLRAAYEGGADAR